MKLHFLLFNVLSAWVLVSSSTFPTSAQTQGQNHNGRIRGNLIFPSDVLLAQKVCAENVQTKKMICVETKQSQANFSIQSPPGTYYVFAKVCNRSYRSNKFCSDGYGERRAYYNAYVRCGLTYQCEKSVRVNYPIPVRVNSGEIVREVKPHDWYTKQLVPSDIVLPGRCHMGECWDNKFIEKKLLKEGYSGNLYSIKTASRSWSMGSQPPKSFGEVEVSYVYCSRTKPSVIFNSDGTYYAHLLNPGGNDVYGYNQSDYPIYWATCHNFVGPDFFSEEMTSRAIKLEYPLNLPSDQIQLNNVLEIMN